LLTAFFYEYEIQKSRCIQPNIDIIWPGFLQEFEIPTLITNMPSRQRNFDFTPGEKILHDKDGFLKARLFPEVHFAL